MSGTPDRRLMALHENEYDEMHYVRVRNALQAVGFTASEDVVLAMGHAILSHPAAAAKLRQLADVWSILGDARPMEHHDRVMFEIK